MFARLFHNISIQSLIRAIIFCWVLGAGFFVVLPQKSFEFSFLANSSQIPFWLFGGGMILSVFVSGFLLNSLVNKIGFLKSDYQLLPIFSLLAFPWLFMAQSATLLIVLPLLSLFFIRLLSLVNIGNPAYVLFDTGVIISGLTLFYPEAIWLVLVIWWAAANFGYFNSRSFFIPLLGIAFLYIILFSLLLLIGYTDVGRTFFSSWSSLIPIWPKVSWEDLKWFIPLLLIGGRAIIENFQVYGKANVAKRQVFTFLSISLLYIVLIGGFSDNHLQTWFWMLVPLSVFCANLLQYQAKTWHKELSYFWLLLYAMLVLFFFR